MIRKWNGSSFMLITAPLDGDSDPGDKGVGLLELKRAGLSVPPTLVLSLADRPFSPHDIVGEVEVSRYLQLNDGDRVIVRPSLLIARHDAPAVSGLYPSIATSVDELARTIMEMTSAYQGSDREAELRILGASGRASRGIRLLLQRLVVPDYSGVIHARRDDLGTLFEGAMVEGHLQDLLAGEAMGMHFELASTSLNLGDENIMVVGGEGDIERLLSLGGVKRALIQLYHSVLRLLDTCKAEREVEWAVDGRGVIFLQSQPIGLRA